MKAHVLLPRTMAAMVAAGCIAASVPLLLALLLAGAALDRLSRHTEQLVNEGLTVARLGAELRDRIGDLERSARQYIALGDPALLDVFYARMLEAESTLRAMEEEGLQEPLGHQIIATRRGLTEAARAWTDGLKDPQSLAGAAERVRQLALEADAIIQSGKRAVDAQVGKLREASQQARTVMAVSALGLIPAAGLLALAVSVAVTRPLRRMSRAIADLGHARYEAPIAIAYPREMQRLGERLDWLRRRLSRLEADKDRFLRHMSHELKTPLASLYEGAELLREGSLGPLTGAQQEVAGILVDSAAELAGLITNLLAYAEWREEGQKAEYSWFEVQPLVEEVLSSHKLLMMRRGISAELDLHCTRLFGQRSRLRIALDNLVTNAIKHAPAGTAIEVHAAEADGTCELWVRDRGRGVPDSEKGRIFEPFVRGTEAEETGIRGTGIGLSIVRDTVLAHGGLVDVQDAHPGARFRLVWPCRARPLGSG